MSPADPDLTARVLVDLARLCAGVRTSGELAQRALEALVTAAGAAGGNLVLLDGERRRLALAYWPGDDASSPPASPAAALEEPPAPPREQPQLWPAETAPPALARLCARLGLATVAAVPLRTAGATVGTLHCAWRTPPADPAALLDLLGVACTLLGAALAPPPPGGPGRPETQSALELRALQGVAEVIAHSRDLDELLGRCLDLTIEVAHAASGSIFLRDERRGRYVCAMARNLATGVAEAPLPLAEVDERLGAATADVIDLSLEQARHPSLGAAFAAGRRRLVLLPLLCEGRRTGILALGFSGESPIGPSTLRTLEAIAGHQAAAIERARAERAVALRSRLATILREYAMRALPPAQLEAHHQLILDTARQLLQADGVLLARIGNGTALVSAAVGTGARLVGREIPLDAPGFPEFLAAKRAVVIEDVGTLPAGTRGQELARESGISSMMAMPLRLQGRLIGYLSIATIQPRAFEPEEVEAVELFSAMAAAVLGREEEASAAAREYELLGLTIEHLPLVVSLIGPDGSVFDLNAAGRAFAERYGTQGESWQESMRHVRTLYPDGQSVPVEENVITRALAGENPPPCEYLFIDRSGTQKVYGLTVAAPVQRDPDGKVRVAVVAFQDVSALRELAESKDRFLRIASHELRSPITSLRATTSLLEMDPSAVTDPARRQVLLDRVKRQVDRLIALVEQLLDSARINAQALPLQFVEHDLCETVREAVGLATAAHVGRRVEIDAPSALTAVFDPQRIEQVINNLVSNALRYSPSDRPVEVRVRGGGGGAPVEVEVVDHGIGIPAEELSRLFTPFFRSAGAATQHKGGLGLGLHIAHEIARRHGGSIEVSSTLGRGSSFTLRLPGTR